jgi:peptide chain release factor 2
VITFDPDHLESRVVELEQELGTPGFWDDQQHAAQVSAEHARLTRRLERYRRLVQDYQDAQELLAMDGEMEGEIVTSIAPLRAELDRLQEDALFSGEYDAGDALVIHAGAARMHRTGEILLRMYLRWAQNRGSDRAAQAAPARAASRRPSASRENAYGILKAERGVRRLVRQSPSMGTAATRLCAGDRQPLLTDDVDATRQERPAHRHLSRQRPWRPRMNKTSAVRITHIPTGIVVQIQNERSQSSNKQTALRVLKSRLLEQEQERREEELAKERGAAQQADFGSQIRSYVLHPYQLVKDHRTEYETGNTQAVLDGALDEFVHEYLLAKAAGKVV